MDGDGLVGSICKVQDGYSVEVGDIVSLQPSLDHAHGFVQGVEVTLESLGNKFDALQRRVERQIRLCELLLAKRTRRER
jgi:hypothetical protein